MKVFVAGACRHAYVATTCILSLSYAKSANLFGKNCRTYEIWGLKIASEPISLRLKLTNFPCGVYPQTPFDTTCGCTFGPHHLEIPCYAPALQFSKFTLLHSGLLCSVCLRRLELGSTLYSEFLLCLKKFVLCMLLIVSSY